MIKAVMTTFSLFILTNVVAVCKMGVVMSDMMGPETMASNGMNVYRGRISPGAIDNMKQAMTNFMQNGVVVTVDKKNTVVSYVIEAELIINGPTLLSEHENFDGRLGISEPGELEAIKQKISQSNQQFIDYKFPPGKTALYFSDRIPKVIDVSNLKWMRPKDLNSQPQLVVDNVNKKDVIQGYLGDCWFLSACAAVTQNPALLDKVIPKGQTLYGSGYTGLLVFKFWRFGTWETVCIDDQLPTLNGELVYARCSNANEFWVPLLEKAYAKMHGSYGALEGGQSKDALVDLTGGFAECYQLSGVDCEFYQHLQRAYNSGAFITCSRKGEWSHQKTDRKGLVSGHAYTVTAVYTIAAQNGKRSNLLRVRNPWGDSAEWNGLWSDKSLKWADVDPQIKKELEVEIKPDGEFWINFKDFCREFMEVTMCTLNLKENADIKCIRSGWEYGKSCGGSRNNIMSFATNPQFKLTILNSNDSVGKKETLDLFGRRNVVIALMQEHRKSKNRMGFNLAHISFVIYQVSYEINARLQPQHFMFHPELTNSGPHTNYREITLRVSLPPGNYVIVPSTFELNLPRPFLLRVHCDTPFEIKELKSEMSRSNQHRPRRKPALISIQL